MKSNGTRPSAAPRWVLPGHALRLVALALVPYCYYTIAAPLPIVAFFVPVLLAASLPYVCATLAITVVLVVAMTIWFDPAVISIALGLQCGAAVAGLTYGRLVTVTAGGTIACGLGIRAGRGLRHALFAMAVVAAAFMLFRSANWLQQLFCVAVLIAVMRSMPVAGVASTRAVAGTYAVLAISTVASLALLEFGSRVVAPAPGMPEAYFMPHPERLFTLRPNGRGFNRLLNNNEELVVLPVFVSSQGLRDDRLYGPKGANEFRIAMLGDSYTLGRGLPIEHTFARVLEARLNDAGLSKKVVAINCGVGGYAPWQEISFFWEHVAHLEPDLVIWQIFPPNDIEGTYATIDLMPPVYNVEFERRLRYYRRQNEPPVWLDRWLHTHSNLYAWAAFAMNGNGPALDWVADFRFLPTYEYPALRVEADRHWLREPCLASWYPELEAAFDAMCGDITDFSAACRHEGIDLIAFAHSDPISLFPDAWDRLNDKARGVRYEMNKDIRMTETCFARARIPHIDVTGSLMTLPPEERHEVFFEHDGHLTAFGARCVGTILAEYLLAEYFPAEPGMVPDR